MTPTSIQSRSTRSSEMALPGFLTPIDGFRARVSNNKKLSDVPANGSTAAKRIRCAYVVRCPQHDCEVVVLPERRGEERWGCGGGGGGSGEGVAWK